MVSANPILLIEDDVDLREALARQFNLHEAFRVEQAATVSEGIEKAETIRPDVIILDIDLPDILLQLHRAAGKSVPCEDLLAVVWGRESPAMLHTLETHMYRLRQKIDPNPSVLLYLITENGGYCRQA